MIFKKKKKQELFGEAKKFHDIATKINEDNKSNRIKEFNEKIKDEIDTAISDMAELGNYEIVLGREYYIYKDLISKEYLARGFNVNHYYSQGTDFNILIGWK